MEDILECCCGLDVHKESIVACLLKGPIGEKLKPQSEVKEFGTQLRDLITLKEWLAKHECRYTLHSPAHSLTTPRWTKLIRVFLAQNFSPWWGKCA